MKKKSKVWIIDDDKILSYVLRRMLEPVEAFGTVEVFENGKEGIEHLKAVEKTPEALPDVILLDLNMPIMDGWQFLDTFEQFKPEKNITLYIVSSSIDQQDHQKAKQYSTVKDFLIKPIGKKQIDLMAAEALKE